MALVTKQSILYISKSVSVQAMSVRPPRFGITFIEDTHSATEGEPQCMTKQWSYATLNGSLVSLGRVIHSYLLHGLIPSGASEIKRQQKIGDEL